MIHITDNEHLIRLRDGDDIAGLDKRIGLSFTFQRIVQPEHREGLGPDNSTSVASAIRANVWTSRVNNIYHATRLVCWAAGEA